MTKAPKHRLIAQIHIAKKQLGLDDETYRAALKSAVGKDSCKGLSLSELYAVIHHFETHGFKASRNFKASNKAGATSRRGEYSPRSRNQMIDKLRAIWIEMHKAGHLKEGSERALISWVKHQTSRMNGGVGVDSLEWLQKDQQMAARVLESLKLWQKRLCNDNTQPPASKLT
ncbi:Mu-like prophage protein gp16 [Oceanospirillum multiglobuliferum]|uniref:GemA protein n=1 Tax=Oceanospirillum multiglobuliferum TaxID=64969 RepID=A0A1T4QZT8_9GAMM|nr:regulatory protein GemA [Oceanospirillum multiglobuliferum]OPX57054.1 hypothetical protein BTE48_01085 [Oceanospirillum multiglobuliferum]SKA08858.1 Mu-like prophage protein gp16 [Oceanospirillum multiglobuliferum]